MDALETLRRMRVGAISCQDRDELAEGVVMAKDLLEQIPRGPQWNAAVGYINGMVDLYHRRFGQV